MQLMSLEFGSWFAPTRRSKAGHTRTQRCIRSQWYRNRLFREQCSLQIRFFGRMGPLVKKVLWVLKTTGSTITVRGLDWTHKGGFNQSHAWVYFPERMLMYNNVWNLNLISRAVGEALQMRSSFWHVYYKAKPVLRGFFWWVLLFALFLVPLRFCIFRGARCPSWLHKLYTLSRCSKQIQVGSGTILPWSGWSHKTSTT